MKFQDLSQNFFFLIKHVTENDNVQIKENERSSEKKMPTSYRNDIILTGTGCLRDSFDE